MELKLVRKILRIVIAGLALAFMAMRFYIVFALTVVLGIVLDHMVSKAIYSRMWEPEFDERDRAVEAMTARMVLRTFLVGGGLTILVFMIIKSFNIFEIPKELDSFLNTLAMTVCILLLLWIPFYLYYRWKLGG